MDLRRRLELDGLIVVLDGAIVLALVVVGDAAIGVGGGRLGVELDRLAVVLDGAVVFALQPVGDTAAAVGFGELFASVASGLDHGGAAVDALTDGHLLLALAPLTLLRGLGVSGGGEQRRDQERRKKHAAHRRLRGLDRGLPHQSSPSGCRSRTRLLRRSSSTWV